MTLRQKMKPSNLGVVLLIVFLLVTFCSEPLRADQSIPEPESTPCKELKPFNDLDELLYQFYVNLDSDCLFEMPVEELEKIWDIKIFASERAQETGQFRESEEFANKPYKNEKDAFYIRMSQGKWTKKNDFYIDITNEYFEKNATLFPDDNYPKLLPEPLTQTAIMLISPSRPGHQEPLCPKNRRRYDLQRRRYYWINSDHTREMSLHGFCGITSILIFNRPAPDSQNNKPK